MSDSVFGNHWTARTSISHRPVRLSVNAPKANSIYISATLDGARVSIDLDPKDAAVLAVRLVAAVQACADAAAQIPLTEVAAS